MFPSHNWRSSPKTIVTEVYNLCMYIPTVIVLIKSLAVQMLYIEVTPD